MTAEHTPPGPAPVDDERGRRARRIVDTAGELLVAWGYRRVTMDEIARRADVGKGTVYLHFPTKEALFLTVLMRSQVVMGERILRDMRADPEYIRLNATARTSCISLLEDPIARALVTGDTEILGALSRSAAERLGPLMEERQRVTREYFETLRDHGLIRTDSTVEQQTYAFSAVVTGFLTIDPLLRHNVPDPYTKVDALAHTVRLAFELDADPESLRAAAPRIIDIYQRLVDLLRDQIHQQKLT